MAEITYNYNDEDGILRAIVTTDQELLVALGQLDSGTLLSILSDLNIDHIEAQTTQEEMLSELKQITKQLKKINC